MSERKLTAWQAAGLIDADTAMRIRAYEAQHSRPLALWAVIGIAALAIGLGVVLVVAANWDAIPGLVRLGIHFALMAGLAGYLWRAGDGLAARQPWLHEGALFVLALLGMAFLGHLGQVYQTSSPLWQPLALWLALFAPVLLARGQSWLIAVLVFMVATYTAWDFAQIYTEDLSSADALLIALVTALTVLFAPLGAWQRGRSARPDFWRRLEQLGAAYALGGTSFAAIYAGVEAFGGSGNDLVAIAPQALRAALGIGAGVVVAMVRPTVSGRAAGAILIVAGLAMLLAYPLSGSRVVGALLFMALWTGVAAASLKGGWRGVFQFAVAVIAVRLIALSFELEDDLLTSGAGLIFSGVLILGVAWTALRVARRFAPPKEGASA